MMPANPSCAVTDLLPLCKNKPALALIRGFRADRMRLERFVVNEIERTASGGGALVVDSAAGVLIYLGIDHISQSLQHCHY